MRPIIDICGVVYDHDSWAVHLRTFADQVPGYLRFFGDLWAVKAGVSRDAFRTALARSPHDAVDLLLGGGGLTQDPQSYLDHLGRQGVVHTVIHGGQSRLPDGTTVNDRTAAFVTADPSRLTGWAGLDLREPRAAIDELQRAVSELGMRGASVVPFNAAVSPTSTGCHDLYEAVAALGVPIWIHTGMSLASNRPLRSCTWDDIDRIAVQHPTLRIVAGHGGWPWIGDAVAVMQRHEHVYLDLSAHRPRVMGQPGSGWEPLLYYGRHAVRSKVLFGSSEFVQSVPIRTLADEVEDLGLGDGAVDAWLHGNAARLLGIDVVAAAAAGETEA